MFVLRLSFQRSDLLRNELLLLLKYLSSEKKKNDLGKRVKEAQRKGCRLIRRKGNRKVRERKVVEEGEKTEEI